MKIFIVTGSRGKGKTNKIQQIANYLKSKNIKFTGFISKPVFQDFDLIGYDLINLENKKKYELMRRNEKFSPYICGGFRYKKSSFSFSTFDIFEALERKINTILLDEIGILELSNSGWHRCLDVILKSNIKFLFLSVRRSALNEIIAKYNLEEPYIYNVDIDAYLEDTIDEFISN